MRAFFITFSYFFSYLHLKCRKKIQGCHFCKFWDLPLLLICCRFTLTLSGGLIFCTPVTLICFLLKIKHIDTKINLELQQVNQNFRQKYYFSIFEAIELAQKNIVATSFSYYRLNCCKFHHKSPFQGIP